MSAWACAVARSSAVKGRVFQAAGARTGRSAARRRPRAPATARRERKRVSSTRSRFIGHPPRRARGPAVGAAGVSVSWRKTVSRSGRSAESSCTTARSPASSRVISSGSLVSLDQQLVAVAGHGVAGHCQHPAARGRVGDAHAGARPGSPRAARRPPGGSSAAVADDRDRVADLLDLGQDVRAQQHGDPGLGEPRISVADVADAGRVEPVGRLVEDQQVGLLEQRRRDREPLLHAQRVGAVAVTVAPGEADRLDRGVDPARGRRRVRARSGRLRRPLNEGTNFGCSTTAPIRPITGGSRSGTGSPNSASRRHSGGPARAASGSWWSCRSRWGRGSRARRPRGPRGRGRRPRRPAPPRGSGTPCAGRASR